jgi:hypothetical protein
MTKTHVEELTDGLSVAQKAIVSRWWRGLQPAERRSLERVVDDEPKLRVIGRFAPPRGGCAEPARIPNVDFYEHLVNHELWLDDGPSFHICTAHSAARAAVSRGLLPASFACPLSDAQCPMRILLDERPGYDVRMGLAGADAGE